MSSTLLPLILLHVCASDILVPTTPIQTPITPSPTDLVVPPTLTNSSGQYWIATNNYQFENGYLYCEASTCYIHCNAAYSCIYSTIICESKSSNCIIQCNEDESCHSTNITSMSSVKTNLLCSSKNSCLSSSIAISSSVITVKCMNQNSCSSSYFTLISNNNYIQNIIIECSNNACNKAIIDANFASELSLQCDGESSCKSAMVYCPNNINACNIYCKNNYNSSCEALNVYATNDYSLDLACDTNNNGMKTCFQLEMFCGSVQDQLSSYMVLSEETGNYICSDVDCCPWMTQESEIITCAKGYDCNINCDNNPTVCSDKIINATDAGSLHVLCLLCNNTSIYCPNNKYNPDTNCVIECMDEFACQFTVIYAGINTNKAGNVENLYTLNVTCSYDYNSCFQSYVEVYNIDMFNLITAQSTENDSIALDEFLNPLEKMIIYTENTTHVNIECDVYHGCYDLSIFTRNTKNVQINCEYLGSCDNILINISTSSYVNIKALDQYALINSVVFVTNTTNFNIYCNSNTKYACNASTIFIPSSLNNNNTYHNTLLCGNYGCGDLDIYSIQGMDDLDVTIHSNCTCQSIEDCMSSWNLYCALTGNEYTNVSVFNGTTCNGLCCDNIVDETELSFDCTTTTFKPLATPAQQYTLFLCIVGLFILCCTTIFVCRRKRTVLGFKNLTRREKNISVMSQYTRMSEVEEQYKPPTQNDRIFNRPKVAETISEMKETDHDESKENPGLTELLGGYKSLKMYDLDPNRRRSRTSNSEFTE